VGYYTQVLGLGTWPSDVRFTGHHGIFAPSEEDNNNFNTFWKAGNWCGKLMEHCWKLVEQTNTSIQKNYQQPSTSQEVNETELNFAEN
jgi:hypothetical protein